jgi:hypothetical protein
MCCGLAARSERTRRPLRCPDLHKRPLELQQRIDGHVGCGFHTLHLGAECQEHRGRVDRSPPEAVPQVLTLEPLNPHRPQAEAPRTLQVKPVDETSRT